MKTKSIALIPSLAAALAVATLLHAAPPADPVPPAELAKHKVSVEIFHKISPPARPFSRVLPVPSHTLEFQPQLLVDGETRLPFAIRPRRTGEEVPPVMLAGYVRLGDQQIFLQVDGTETHVPAERHPLFAPKPPLIVVPAKPA
jgi:hypothetical protein